MNRRDFFKMGALAGAGMLSGGAKAANEKAADGQVKEDVSDCCFIGELSLSGKLRPVSGVLSMVLSSRQAGIKRVFVAKENAP